MKRILSFFGIGMAVIAGFFVGFFVRQPKINKLKSQIEHLQKELKKLEILRDKQNDTIKRLLIDYKSLKIFDFVKRSKAKENIKAELALQYGTKEYLQLLLDRVKNNREFSNEEMIFFSAFDSVIEGKKISNKDIDKIKAYIFNKYRKEIKGLIPCDYNELVMEIKKYKNK